MATYFVEFYAEKKHRAMFVEYKAGVTEEYCQHLAEPHAVEEPL